MTDIVDRKTRSRMMAGIRGKNTRPEMLLRSALHALGFRYRLHVRNLPGCPDLVLPGYNAVIFVNGCFWHRHKGCSYATNPSSNKEFWKRKFADTIARDRRNLERLRQAGWRIAIVWECTFKENPPGDVAERVAEWLKGDSDFIEMPRHAEIT